MVAAEEAGRAGSGGQASACGPGEHLRGGERPGVRVLGGGVGWNGSATGPGWVGWAAGLVGWRGRGGRQAGRWGSRFQVQRRHGGGTVLPELPAGVVGQIDVEQREQGAFGFFQADQAGVVVGQHGGGVGGRVGADLNAAR